MTTTPFTTQDFDTPIYDADTRQTLSVVIDLHPGLGRMINHVITNGCFPFQDRDQLLRWCVALGIQTLLGSTLTTKDLFEVKMNIVHDERYQAQKDCLAVSVEKHLRADEIGSALRLVAAAWDSYNRIDHRYWRQLWLASLEYPIELLRRRGIQFTPPSQNGNGAR